MRGLGGVTVRVLASNLCVPVRISGRALHVGKLVVTCRCPVVYSAVCTGFLHLQTTRCNMTLAVERNIKQINKYRNSLTGAGTHINLSVGSNFNFIPQSR